MEFDMQDVCNKHKITLILDEDDAARNTGASAGQDTIIMGKFDDSDIQIVAFFHELGHCLFKPVNNQWMSTVSMEGTAWEVGRTEAEKYGFNWGYNSKELVWAREQLASYYKTHISKERQK